MDKDSKTIIFLHIPKTAGSTFHSILNKKYKTRHVQNVFGSRYSEPAIEAFIKAPLESKKHIKMLKGHMPYGLHQYLPGSSTYIAFLRDPVERVISLYYYIIKNTQNPLHEAVAVNKMTLTEFVTSGIAKGTNNGQCRFINGDFDEYDFEQNDESLYANVLNHIENNFLWLGITERFDESLLVLAELLNWPRPPHYFRGNISKIRKKTSRIDQDSIAVIEKYNPLDRRLYDYANSLLDEQISKIPDFEKKLASYQAKNKKMQQTWGWLPDMIRQMLV